MSKRKLFELGGIIAGVILVAFGVVALVLGTNGLSTVKSNLKAEQIYFGDAAQDPAIPAKYSGLLVDNGEKARAFAKVMREHTLESTSGLTYAQMGRFVAASGKGDDGLGGTNNPEAAATDPNTGDPISNPARNIWVTETALTTALNTAYMAERISFFGIVVGVALLLSGVGFLILAVGGALRRAEKLALPGRPAPPVTPIPTT
jgi:hypothetical protein